MNRKDIKQVTAALILILLVSFVVDKFVYFTLDSISSKVFSGQTVGKLNHFLSIKDSVDILVFGSSRANHHIDVDLLTDNGFNMGVDRKNIAYISTLIMTLSNRPQILIINIEPSYIFNNDYEGSDIKALFIMYHKNKIIKSEIDQLGQSNPLQRFYWCIDFNNKALGLLRNYLKPKYNYKKYNGFDPLILNETQKEIRENILNIENEVENKNSDINNLSLGYLIGIRDFCASNSKQLIMLTTPRYKNTSYAVHKRLAEVMNELNITYRDYSTFFNNNNSVENWKDRGHLSKTGASLFSKRLSEDLKNYPLK
jgi:hypothetical protein